MLNYLLKSIEAGDYLLTGHAREEMMEDNLTLAEIVASVRRGEIIEDYPTDFPFPSSLIFGTSQKNDPIHSVWAYDERSELAILITVYRPDPGRWVEFRTRR